MVISNAKYNKRNGGLKNRGYLSMEQDGEMPVYPIGADISDFEIPLLRELTYLQFDDLEN